MENKNEFEQRFEKAMMSNREIKEYVSRLTDDIQHSAILIAGGASDTETGDVYSKIGYQGDTQVLYSLISKTILAMIESEIEDCNGNCSIAEVCTMVMRNVNFGAFKLLKDEFGNQFLPEDNDECKENQKTDFSNLN